MHVEHNAMKRESAVLLMSAASDKRLMEALTKVEEMSIQMDKEKEEHQIKV